MKEDHMVAAKTTTAELKALGFNDEVSEVPRRLIASLEGHEKAGKTHIALTAPAPILFFNIDVGTEGVVEKFQTGTKDIAAKQVFVYDVRFSKALGVQVQADYATIWQDLKVKLAKAWSMGAGTVVIDTASEAHELSRLAAFGKLTQVLPHHYGPVNAEWRELIRLAYDSPMNTILIHKLKVKYVNEQRTNQYEVKGFGETGYLVQANLVAMREDEEGVMPKWGLRVRDCRQNPSLNGSEFWQPPMNNFEFLLKLVHPGK